MQISHSEQPHIINFDAINLDVSSPPAPNTFFDIFLLRLGKIISTQVSNANEVTDVHDVSASFGRIFEVLLLLKFDHANVNAKAIARLNVLNTDHKAVTVTATVIADCEVVKPKKVVRVQSFDPKAVDDAINPSVELSG